MNITHEQLKAQLPVVQGVQHFYRLRWKFVFSDGKPDRYGQWNGSQITAWDINKSNLLYAIIEGEKVGCWAQEVLVRIPGQIYATCKWVYACSVMMNFGGKIHSTEGTPVGLSVYTNEEMITAYVTGKIVKKPLSDHDKKFMLREHSMEE